MSKENKESGAKDQADANKELREHAVRIRETTEVVRVVEAASREGAEELARHEWYESPYPDNHSDVTLEVMALTDNDRPSPAQRPPVSPEGHNSNRVWEATPRFWYQRGKDGCDETFDIFGPDSERVVSIRFWAEREKAEKTACELVDRLNLPGLSAEAREEAIRTALAHYTQAVGTDQSAAKSNYLPETLANAPDPVCPDCKHIESKGETHECPTAEYLQGRNALMKDAVDAEEIFSLDELEAFGRDRTRRNKEKATEPHQTETHVVQTKEDQPIPQHQEHQNGHEPMSKAQGSGLMPTDNEHKGPKMSEGEKPKNTYTVKVVETCRLWGEVKVHAASQEEAEELAAENFVPSWEDSAVEDRETTVLTENGAIVQWDSEAWRKDAKNPYQKVADQVVIGEKAKHWHDKLSPETITALTEVIDYLWDDEAQDYEAEPRPDHIFTKLVALRDLCETHQEQRQEDQSFRRKDLADLPNLSTDTSHAIAQAIAGQYDEAEFAHEIEEPKLEGVKTERARTPEEAPVCELLVGSFAFRFFEVQTDLHEARGYEVKVQYEGKEVFERFSKDEFLMFTFLDGKHSEAASEFLADRDIPISFEEARDFARGAEQACSLLEALEKGRSVKEWCEAGGSEKQVRSSPERGATMNERERESGETESGSNNKPLLKLESGVKVEALIEHQTRPEALLVPLRLPDTNQLGEGMKLPEATKKAVETQDAVMLGNVVDQLRFQLGYDYERCFQFVHKQTGIGLADYDAMLYDADIAAGERAQAQERTVGDRFENLGEKNEQEAAAAEVKENFGNERGATMKRERENGENENATKKKPILKLESGVVRAFIFDNGPGREPTATVARIYKNQKTGSWAYTQSFRERDFDDLEKLVRELARNLDPGKDQDAEPPTAPKSQAKERDRDR